MKPHVSLLLCACILASPLLVAAPAEVIPLWPGGAPGFESRMNEPEVAKDYWIKNINNPSLTVFLPAKEKANGAAVVIFPGGGFKELVFQREGADAEKYFNDLGVAAFVVKYRLGREPASPYRVEREGPMDGKRAMRLVRSRAADWGLDPKRIGIMGFSAGGEMVSMVVYDPTDGDPSAADPVERMSSRPDFQVVIYPGPLRAPVVIPKTTPPAFFLAAVDDKGPAQTITGLLQGYEAAGVPIEVHLYSRGGHAFNMGDRSLLATLKKWPDRLTDWMADNGILDPNHVPKDEHH
jgi:acetyl esterase/lipase